MNRTSLRARHARIANRAATRTGATNARVLPNRAADRTVTRTANQGHSAKRRGGSVRGFTIHDPEQYRRHPAGYFHRSRESVNPPGPRLRGVGTNGQRPAVGDVARDHRRNRQRSRRNTRGGDYPANASPTRNRSSRRSTGNWSAIVRSRRVRPARSSRSAAVRNAAGNCNRGNAAARTRRTSR